MRILAFWLLVLVACIGVSPITAQAAGTRAPAATWQVELDRARKLRLEMRIVPGEEAALRALKLARAEEAKGAGVLAALEEVGRLQYSAGKFKAAEGHLQELLSLRGADPVGAGPAQAFLAMLRWHHGRCVEAQNLAVDALGRLDGLEQTVELRRARALLRRALAKIYSWSRMSEHGRPLLLGALEDHEAVWGPESPELVETLADLGFMLSRPEPSDRTQALLARARVLAERHFDPASPVFGLVLSGEMEAQMPGASFDDLVRQRQIVDLFRLGYPPKSPWGVFAEWNWLNVCEPPERFELIEKLLARLERGEMSKGPLRAFLLLDSAEESPDMARRERVRRTELARDLLVEAFGETHPSAVSASLKAAAADGRQSVVRATWSRQMEHLGEWVGSSPEAVAKVLGDCAPKLAGLLPEREAFDALALAHVLIVRADGPGGSQALLAATKLAAEALRIGDFAEAARVLEASLAERSGPGQLEDFGALGQLSRALRALGRWDELIAVRERSLALGAELKLGESALRSLRATRAKERSRAGRWSESVPLLLAAIAETEPGNRAELADLSLSLGISHRRLGQATEGLAALERSVAEQGGRSVCLWLAEYEACGALIDVDRISEAAVRLEELVKRLRSDPRDAGAANVVLKLLAPLLLRERENVAAEGTAPDLAGVDRLVASAWGEGLHLRVLEVLQRTEELLMATASLEPSNPLRVRARVFRAQALAFAGCRGEARSALDELGEELKTAGGPSLKAQFLFVETQRASIESRTGGAPSRQLAPDAIVAGFQEPGVMDAGDAWGLTQAAIAWLQAGNPTLASELLEVAARKLSDDPTAVRDGRARQVELVSIQAALALHRTEAVDERLTRLLKHDDLTPVLKASALLLRTQVRPGRTPIPELRAALAAMEKSGAPLDPLGTRIVIELAIHELAAGKVDPAAVVARAQAGLDAALAARGEPPEWVLVGAVVLGICHLDLGDAVAARRYLEPSFGRLPNHVAPDSFIVPLAYGAMSSLRLADGRFEEAESLIRHALSLVAERKEFVELRAPYEEQLARILDLRQKAAAAAPPAEHDEKPGVGP